MLLIGCTIALASILAATLFQFPYWYTPFLVGSFLLSDDIHRRREGDSTLARLVRGEWLAFATNYVVAIFFALIVDIWFGRVMAHAWVYPPYEATWLDTAVPLLLHYPLGMLALVENFYAIRSFLGRKDAGTSQPLRTFNLKSRFGSVSLIVLALCIVLPPANFYFNANRYAGELLFVIMLVSTVAFDGVRELFVGHSFIGDAGRERGTEWLAVFVTVVVGFALNEGPNVLAREWVYTREPFGIPLPVTLGVGWIFLLSVSLAVRETTFALVRRYVVRESPVNATGRNFSQSV